MIPIFMRISSALFIVAKMSEKYDPALLGILQHEGKIEKFLNVILSFLYRRTDFYRIMKSRDDKLGFPPGVSLKMLTAIFEQYDSQAKRDDELREAQAQQMTKTTPRTEQMTKTTPNTEQMKTSAEQAKANVDDETMESHVAVKPDASLEGSSDTAFVAETNTNKQTQAAVNPEFIPHNDTQSTTAKAQASGDQSATKTDSKDTEDSHLTKQQAEFQSNPDSYNGAVRDNYSWAQSITDLDVKVKVPSYIKKGRDVKVDIAKKHLKVSHKDDQGQWKVLVDGSLTWEVHKDECIWTLNPGANVQVTLEKREERWWEALLDGEEKISVRKIDASRPMTDLDDEAQAKIEEMMYNDRRKKMGLPTSQEQKVQDIMKNAWDAEGSPFKGQAYDPSKFSVDPSGLINMKPS
ncbi:nudC domain-containing protein 3-like isoform X2 [Mya arenaria]|uniref:nudC domain-containing protein 3-like isoform X2 n=1 Tax=Mya arenaria TaxID=6604 RepID=UPI0022E0707F|nr:nudC domain-containing protein 3-like isoform X2 [Mya arenaria]